MTRPPTNPLHLYRALLRECTYLPDPRARTYFHHYIVQSFRRHLPDIKEWRRTIPFKRQVKLLHQGRKRLSMLQRANEGYPKSLEKVLMETYGRQGRRRRELMTKYTADDGPQNQTEVENFVPTRRYSIGWKPPSAMLLLIRSQAAHQRQLSNATRQIQVHPTIPEKNIWGRNLSLKRRANITRKWYARNANLVLPPLPEEEYVHLRSLATGQEKWNGSVPRRKQCRDKEAEPEATPSSEALLEGPKKGETFEPFVRGRPRTITSRLMRHMWAHVLRHTPRVVVDGRNDQSTVRWEGMCNRAPHVVEPTQAQRLALFGDS